MDQFKKYIFLTPLLGLIALFLPFISLGAAGDVNYFEASYAVFSGMDQIITLIVMAAYILINVYLIYLMYSKAGLTTVITFSVIDILLLVVYTFFFFFKMSDFVAIAALVDQHAGVHWIWFIVVIVLNLAAPFSYPFMPARKKAYASKTNRSASAGRSSIPARSNPAAASSSVAALKKAAAKRPSQSMQSQPARRQNVPIKPRSLPAAAAAVNETAEPAREIQPQPEQIVQSIEPIQPVEPIQSVEPVQEDQDLQPEILQSEVIQPEPELAETISIENPVSQPEPQSISEIEDIEPKAEEVQEPADIDIDIFEGQIEALNGVHKGEVLPLIQKTRLFFEEENGQPIAAITPENAFLSIFYIPEYEEYAIDVNELNRVFLQSGQALGTRGTYYLPRGTQLKVLDDLYLLS